MEAFLADARPATVLDCPFGTGRWIPQYEAAGANVLAVDLSQAMLDEAAAKLSDLPQARRDAYDLRCESIFDLAPASGQPTPDLAVCVRFLNWVDLAQAEVALQRLTAFGTPRMILGVSVVPRDAGPLLRARYRLSLALINLRRRGKPQQHVHPEAEIDRVLGKLGWTVVSRREIMRRNARVNYFYLLSRA